MHPNSNNLDRLLRRILKGQEVPAEEIFFHWRGMEQQGDRLVINQLNKLEGWDKFLAWIATQPGAELMLRSMADRAGVPENAIQAFRRMNIPVSVEKSQRTKAQWILDVVKENRKGDWDQARLQLQQDLDLLEGILPMMENLDYVPVAIFLNSLLRLEFPDTHDHFIRKSLYHLKQKGIVPPSEENVKPKAERDFLYLGENRIALWQPVLFFRYASTFSDLSDLYTIRIMEGRDSSSVNQQRGIRVSREELSTLVTDYSEHLKQDIGAHIPFRSVSLPQARYFLEKSMRLQASEDSVTNLKDFLKLIGGEPAENPWSTLQAENSAEFSFTETETAQMLDSEYFASWAFFPDDFREYLSGLEKLQEGPIILTEQQVHEMSHSSATDALQKYMEGPARIAWSFAFEKAAFFLRDTDPRSADLAGRYFRALLDRHLSPERVPALAMLLTRMTVLLHQRKQAQQEEEKKSSVIVSPQEFARQVRRNQQGQ